MQFDSLKIEELATDFITESSGPTDNRKGIRGSADSPSSISTLLALHGGLAAFSLLLPNGGPSSTTARLAFLSSTVGHPHPLPPPPLCCSCSTLSSAARHGGERARWARSERCHVFLIRNLVLKTAKCGLFYPWSNPFCWIMMDVRWRGPSCSMTC